MSRANVGRALDSTSEVLIYQGANLTQLCKLFAMEHSSMVSKIQGVIPSGERQGVPVYRIRDVAQCVARPSADQVERVMQHMNAADLPKVLTKEYWAGKRSRQEFELKEGQLWPTAEVVKEVGELFKLVKTSAQLAADAVDRQVELSERQRIIIKGLMDGMLNDLQKAVSEKFTGKRKFEVKADAGQDQVDESL